MLELIVIYAIVAVAGWYAWKKLARMAAGKKACCDSGDEACKFRDFIEKEGHPERLNCSAKDRARRMARVKNAL